MNNLVSHLVVAIIIWLSAMVGFICSLTTAKRPRVLSLGNTFGGGVLLAAGLVHLSNDSFEDFDSAAEGTWSKRYEYPWAAFFVSLGFVITLFVEVIVLSVLERSEQEHPLMEPLCGQDIEEGTLEESLTPTNSITSRTLSGRMFEVAANKEDRNHDCAENVTQRGMAVAFVFLLAISCHSFIAGLGVGALTGFDLWSGMIAIIAHKGMATYTLATCFIKAGCPNVTLTFNILMFSLVTPIGILCGSLITGDGGATEGILVGLAGGSFLYIGILEVISREMETQIDQNYKLLVLFLGWGLMSALAIWV